MTCLFNSVYPGYQDGHLLVNILAARICYFVYPGNQDGHLLVNILAARICYFGHPGSQVTC